jgi:group I intron endonuclease
LIAFLGYYNSPKWSKINNKSKYLFNKKNLPLIQKRYYSNNLGITKYTNITKTLSDFIKKENLTPIFSYEDLELSYTRKKILQDTKGLSGIYLILNKITLDYYIGSASTNKFYARFSNHLIYFKGSKIVKNAVKKYKLSNFAFLILELFPEIVNRENNKNLLDKEDFYLKSMLPNYNILTEAGSSFGYKHTEIDRIKMKSNYSLERRLRIGNLNKNKTLSLETIEKIRNKALFRDRTKINISEQSLLNMKKRSKPIILYNLDKTVFGNYNSITEAAKSINCNIKTIIRALKTDKKILKKRFIVNYLEKLKKLI